MMSSHVSMSPASVHGGDRTGEQFWAGLHGMLFRPNIPALDSIRAIAVLLVIAYHFGVPYVNGALGVEMFFVLSGFLITWLLLREFGRTGGISLSAFYLRRTLRIFPAFYAFFILAAGIEVVRHRPLPWAHSLSALLYVSNYFNALVHPPDSFVSHTWSLAIEEQFYLLWPALFLFLARRAVDRTRVIAGLVGVIAVYRAGLHLSGVSQGYIYHAFDTRLDQLLVGCLLAVVLWDRRAGRFCQAMCRYSWAPLLVFALIFGSALLDLHSTPYRNIIGFTLEPLLIAVLLMQLVFMHTQLPWSWVQWGPLRAIGRISYGLYLYQQVTLSVPDRWFGPEPTVVKFVVAFAITLAFAAGSYVVVERPLLRLKDRLAGRAPEKAGALQVAVG